jgi:hypothetical protein
MPVVVSQAGALEWEGTVQRPKVETGNRKRPASAAQLRQLSQLVILGFSVLIYELIERQRDETYCLDEAGRNVGCYQSWWERKEEEGGRWRVER